MSGLRLYDAAGNVLYDTTKRSFLILGTVANTGQGAGSVSVPGFANFNGVKEYIAMSLGSPFDEAPMITISGTTLSWSFRVNNSNLNAPHRIMYGIW